MEGGSRRPVPAAAVAAAGLPDELIVEILARLPFKSICRFKCVSRAWAALISDPANRRRFAQTLSGFFFCPDPDASSRPSWDFIGVSMSSILPPPPGVDTALSFLPQTLGEMELMDSCNGLLLLRCEDSRELPSRPPFYVVCNPATGDWVALPQTSLDLGRFSISSGPFRDSQDTGSAALGFDPSISPHFHVFQLVRAFDPQDYFVRAVEIYSSQTGRWVLSEIDLTINMKVAYEIDYIRMTYFKGFLHFCKMSTGTVSVDTEGKTWKISRLQHGQHGVCGFSVCCSQGRLLYVECDVWQSDVLSIYVLEDHDSEEWKWIFKQSISMTDLFGQRISKRIWDYTIAAFHPDSDLIFLYDWPQKRLVSYDMKHRDVHVICTPEASYFEFDGRQDLQRLFLPYVPLYSRVLSSSSLL